MVAQLKRSDCIKRISLLVNIAVVLSVDAVRCHGYPTAVRRRRGRCGCTRPRPLLDALAATDPHQTISAQYRRFIIMYCKSANKKFIT